MTRIPVAEVSPRLRQEVPGSGGARSALAKLAFADALLAARMAASRYLTGAGALLYDPEEGFLARKGEEAARLFEEWESADAKLVSLATANLSPEAARLFDRLTREEREQNRKAAAWAASARRTELHLGLIGEEAERLGARAWSAGADAGERLAALKGRWPELARLSAEAAAVVGGSAALSGEVARRCASQAALGAARTGAAVDPVGAAAFVESATPEVGAEAFAPLKGELLERLLSRLSAELVEEAVAGSNSYAEAREAVVEASMGAPVTRRALGLLEERYGAPKPSGWLEFSPELREEFAKVLAGRFPPDREGVSRALLAWELRERGVIDDEAARSALFTSGGVAR